MSRLVRFIRGLVHSDSYQYTSLTETTEISSLHPSGNGRGLGDEIEDIMHFANNLMRNISIPEVDTNGLSDEGHSLGDGIRDIMRNPDFTNLINRLIGSVQSSQYTTIGSVMETINTELQNPDVIEIRSNIGLQVSQETKKTIEVEIIKRPEEIKTSDDEENNCVVCFENAIDTTLVPCNHLSLCYCCAKKLQKCPMCREKITKFKVYEQSSHISE